MTHVERIRARPGRPAPWPDWVPPRLVDALGAAGIPAPWEHQAHAAHEAHEGRSVVVATGTASGKSLAYQLPVLSALLSSEATALYVSPTKALAADQGRALCALALPGVRAGVLDGDTSREEREWVRAHATLVLTNPDMLHHAILPRHARWRRFVSRLAYVVVDECHGYRGVFGSHVAHVLRRLRRVCARYGTQPVFVLASATVSDPAISASRLVGIPFVAVTADASPRGEVTFVLWEPPPAEGRRGERGAPLRRTATAEAADLLAALAIDGVRTVAFVRSRRGAEALALSARRTLGEVDARLAGRVAAYRAGYLPEERRALERSLRSGDLLGLAATNALELGVDVAGLDAVVLAGWPGTLASLWQQAGRAGRSGRGALAVLVARDDPLDTYLVHHPSAIFSRPVEATVLDPDNPYVLGPQLCAAAAELPLIDEDLQLFGPAAPAVLEKLGARGLLRRRPTGWFWTRRERAGDLADLRGVGGPAVRIVEQATGRLLGTVEAGSADRLAHEGAVYLHQGATFVVRRLDLAKAVAFVEPGDPDVTTVAREVTDVAVVRTLESQQWEAGKVTFGIVDVTARVVAYQRRRLLTGEVLGERPLDLPARELRTRAVWWTLNADVVAAAGVRPAAVAGAAHAAEHASIGLLPLVATCDRWDIGGVSTPCHPDTGMPTVFVHDGHPGGAGFAERAFHRARDWLTATRKAIAACACSDGCPSCVQSAKCGNGNDPLDKAGAVRLLDALLSRSA
ncbi:MAG TPA: DEAD/DEAH box helicase [Mycobacteriales bacterium]|nr:DEAD/DEAH box helicase [Mycobacteriales bacterium]